MKISSTRCALYTSIELNKHDAKKVSCLSHYCVANVASIRLSTRHNAPHQTNLSLSSGYNMNAGTTFDSIFGADYESVLLDARVVCKRLRINDDPNELINSLAARFIRKRQDATANPNVLDSASYRRKCLYNAGLDHIRARTNQRDMEGVGGAQWQIDEAGHMPPCGTAELDAREVVESLFSRLSPNATRWLRIILSRISASEYARRTGMNIRTAQRRFSAGLKEVRDQLTPMIIDIYGYEAWEEFQEDLRLAAFASEPDLSD